ncbi:M16 family metallopeptidase [Sphingosinicella terrae]|uniref:M16 family metallopeptidase n=1 Tax=Sphingosinicella terrae TaxID=2172047 RepID=UPI0013B3DAD4|nr:M16 family metallopeptidase [Sphingosinicella terrae]
MLDKATVPNEKLPMILLRALLLPLLILIALPAPALAQGGDSDWLYRGSDIAPDPAWRFGTLPNGLRYAVRRNALPAGQVSIRIRIDAGSMHEEDGERGWAHYVEHMLFRGTESYPDRRARQIWQELGASFGSDSNARTTPNETVYQLNLPHAERPALDTSLAVLAEMMWRARFDQAAVEAERPVILAEKGRRPELTQRMVELSRRLFYAGLLYGERDPIGTDETLNAATADGLKAFYRRWYRPDRTHVVMVGDADPAMMEELIRARFGGWTAEGPPPAEPDYGRIAEVAQPVANLAYPGTPLAATVMWLRPYEALPHTMERERLYLEESLAERILNRRLEAHARGESAFINASVDAGRSRNVTFATSLSVVAREQQWQPSLEQAFAIVADALRDPPSASEIDRELRNLRTAVSAAVQGEDTAQSQVRAEQLIGAIGNGAVVTTARTVLDNFERNAPQMTPERVGEAMQRLFAGAGPRMMLVSPEPVAGGEATLASALAAAQAAAPAIRAADRSVSFDDLPPLGPPGQEVSRQHVEDLDVTIVRFANGSTLTFKPTRFEQGSVQVRLRFGAGQAGFAPDQPSLGWLGGLVGPSGLAGLDLEGMERLLTGRRMAMTFAIGEDAFVLAGQTNSEDLADQLRLLATKLTHPEWDPALFARFRSAAVESFDLHFSSASARATREMGGFIRPDDQRWRPIERQEMAAVTVEQFRDFFAPLLSQGPVHAVIVGDMELEAAVEAMRRTVASLPPRPQPAIPAEAAQVRPPAPDPQPRTFTHEGDPNQAFAMIGWSTLGGRDRIEERRALALAANMFQARLFDRLREEEGATYSPNGAHLSSDSFPQWGIFYASAEIRPDRAETFFRVAREIVADLAARPALADEFTRARNPVISGIERRLATNAYWVGAVENWVEHPEEIESVRSYLADYRALTPEDVRQAVASWVADQGDWSMLVLPSRGVAERSE